MAGEHIAVFETLGELRHGETLLPMISRFLEDFELKPADLDIIVCSRGPGSFTGLRIGMTTAKGLSEGTGVPLVSVDTLDALARGFAFFDGAVIPVIDARKGRLYGALYEKGKRISEQLDCSADELLHLSQEYSRVLLTGPASDALEKIWKDERRGVYRTPAPVNGAAYSLAVLGIERYRDEGPDDPGQGPVYIRKSDAELNRK